MARTSGSLERQGKKEGRNTNPITSINWGVKSKRLKDVYARIE